MKVIPRHIPGMETEAAERAVVVRLREIVTEKGGNIEKLRREHRVALQANLQLGDAVLPDKLERFIVAMGLDEREAAELREFYAGQPAEQTMKGLIGMWTRLHGGFEGAAKKATVAYSTLGQICYGDPRHEKDQRKPVIPELVTWRKIARSLGKDDQHDAYDEIWRADGLKHFAGEGINPLGCEVELLLKENDKVQPRLWREKAARPDFLGNLGGREVRDFLARVRKGEFFPWPMMAGLLQEYGSSPKRQLQMADAWLPVFASNQASAETGAMGEIVKVMQGLAIAYADSRYPELVLKERRQFEQATSRALATCGSLVTAIDTAAEEMLHPPAPQPIEILGRTVTPAARPGASEESSGHRLDQKKPAEAADRDIVIDQVLALVRAEVTGALERDWERMWERNFRLEAERGWQKGFRTIDDVLQHVNIRLQFELARRRGS